jgi:class 3 adenylate cyclase/tetratricopeptide (TPR) repeat protein
VAICSNCGEENPNGFKFCGNCASPLEAAPAAREQRKTVTVLFCDVTGSTALGESTDPEAVRALLARYFERMKGIIESHGGTVEKFIGDAVMAVFGVPQVHEDDALRACRAAVEMRAALPELGLQARIGLNTGEVVTGTEERLATGDAVNVAARLEQAAQPGEILLGAETLALVQRAVETEPLEPLELKGKGSPVPVFRLWSLHETPERPHETRFVGRVRELELLRDAWKRVLDEGRCELVTIAGEAGVGKSRLAAEFVDAVGVRSVYARCLPYGDGITYWPVIEVLKQLDALPSDPAASASLRSLVGASDGATSADEIAWAFRKLLEEQAPIVCLFDDIQWGEDTFLDLMEQVALLANAPILLMCLARPELGERRPEWQPSLRLGPLPDRSVTDLIPETLGAELRERIVRAAGGNPLFLTEMVAMASANEGDSVVPPNLKALLAARLDQLDPAERSALERGAVEGEIFHRGAVQALTRDQQVTSRLAALARKNLIRPDRPQLPDEDAFRFRHLLIRDAAYDALPKATRAELHEGFADWLEERGQDLVELDEILGFHLEQAAQYRAELGRPDPSVSERAGERLAAAGRRALWRGDRHAAAPLLERALSLTRAIQLDVHLELDLGDAKATPQEQAALAEEVARKARERSDEVGEALALVAAAEARLHYTQDAIGQVQSHADVALPLLQEIEDHAGLARVWTAIGAEANMLGRFEDWTRASEESLRHRRAARELRVESGGLPTALVRGPRPADDAIVSFDDVLSGTQDPWSLLRRAQLLAMLGRFEEAWAIALPAGQRALDVTGGEEGGFGALAEIATLAGDHESAARYRRRACDLFEQQGWKTLLSTYAPWLGSSLCALGRYDEAEPLAQLGRELGDEKDVATQMLWRRVQALVEAARGRYDEAVRLAREAVEACEPTDALNWQGETFRDQYEVLAAAGRTDEAAEALEQALDRYERKKNLAMVARVKPKLEELRARVS